MNDIPPTVRRVTWALATVLLFASVAAAAVAAGILAVPSPSLRLLLRAS